MSKVYFLSMEDGNLENKPLIYSIIYIIFNNKENLGLTLVSCDNIIFHFYCTKSSPCLNYAKSLTYVCIDISP